MDRLVKQVDVLIIRLNIKTVKQQVKSACYVMHYMINPLNAELNPICHLLALLEVRHILHVSRVRVKSHIYSF